jgi:histidine ammonia-lyase
MLARAHAVIRERVPRLEDDRPLHPDIVAVRALIDGGELVAATLAIG